MPFSKNATYAGSPRGATYVIDSGLIKQFDRIGNLRKTVDVADFPNFAVSPNGYAFAILEESAADSAKFEVYDIMFNQKFSGQVLSGSTLFPSDSGDFVVVSPAAKFGRKSVQIYDSAGVKIGQTTVTGCDSVVFMSALGRILLDSGANGLRVIERDGAQVAIYPACNVYSVSPDGEGLATFGSGALRVYKGDSLVARHNVTYPSVRKIYYDRAHERIMIMVATNFIIIGAIDGKFLLEYPVISSGRFYTDFDYDSQEDMIALAILVSYSTAVKSEKRANNCALRILTPDGEELPFYYVIGARSRQGYPRVSFSNKGISAMIFGADQIHMVGW
ncbi:MAG: hypothetical protein IIB00_00255 [candidate division Zixibacteria bacterium]|nr:hypothetical protein [candidate division Zixibacteria bacterium]